MFRIGVALPHTRLVYHRLFVHSFFCMERPVDLALLTPQSTGPIDTARNELCQQALLLDCTHIFWCDTDQVYPPNTLTQLLSHDLPIVCAKVHRRHEPYDALLKRYNPNKLDKLNPYIDVPYEEWGLRSDANGLVEIDATGFGCNLMRIEVIEKMPRPWFVMKLYQKPTISEDFYFWDQAKKLGYRIYADCSLDIGHIADAVVNSRTYLAYRESCREQEIKHALG